MHNVNLIIIFSGLHISFSIKKYSHYLKKIFFILLEDKELENKDLYCTLLSFLYMLFFVIFSEKVNQ